MPRNAFYAQSGGVTAVINVSAAGVIETARRYPDKIGKVYAGRNGIVGALTEDRIDTSLESHEDITALKAVGMTKYSPNVYWASLSDIAMDKLVAYRIRTEYAEQAAAEQAAAKKAPDPVSEPASTKFERPTPTAREPHAHHEAAATAADQRGRRTAPENRPALGAAGQRAVRRSGPGRAPARSAARAPAPGTHYEPNTPHRRSCQTESLPMVARRDPHSPSN